MNLLLVTVVLGTGSAGDYREGVIGISGRLQILQKNIPDEASGNIQRHVTEAAESFRRGGQIRIPCEEVIAVAKK